MGAHFPEHSPLVHAAERRAPAPVDLATIANPRLAQPGSGAVRVDTAKVQLYVLAGFMSDAECDELVDAHRPAFAPVHDHASFERQVFPDQPHQRSSLVFSPIVSRIDDKIAQTLGITAYSEGIQAQRYDVGQEFKPHTDYFEPGTDEYASSAARGATVPGRSWCISTTSKAAAVRIS